jgi:hypothetical protein
MIAGRKRQYKGHPNTEHVLPGRASSDDGNDRYWWQQSRPWVPIKVCNNTDTRRIETKKPALILKHIGIPSWVVRFVLPSFPSTSHGLMKKSFILKSVSHELVSNTSSCGSRFQF